ncbi:MAG TPA: hypothetical protein VIY52_19080 [Streptosporangiaceae bacterium]
MATQLNTFPGPRPPQGRYPWDEWTNGRPWRITRGEDYDIPTENMRANLHMRASSMGRKVQTQKTTDDQGEGLIFQFSADETEQDVATEPENGQPDDDTLLKDLHVDLTELYERARMEVRYTTPSGRTRRYAAVRFKQKIDRVYATGSLQQLVAAVNKWVRSEPRDGFLILQEAGRLDLSVEKLVLKEDKPYHHLFPATTLQRAREKLDE